MADLITVGDGVYYTGFSTGQGGDPSTYVLYDVHLDVNFLTLLDAVNRIWSRLMSMTGVNAEMVSYIAEINDPNSPEGDVADTGMFGEHSYECALKGGDPTKIIVQPGSALRGGELVTLSAEQEVNGTGVVASPPGWAYLSWDANGSVQIDDSTSTYDFARWYWSGGQFTGSAEYLVPTLIDGDAWRELQEVPASLAFLSAAGGTYRQPHYRVNAIERLLSGYDTDALAQAIGPICFPFGAVGDPQVCFGAAGVADAAGWFRSASGQWAYAVSGSQVFRAIAQGIRYAIAGSAAAPLVQLNDDHAGIYHDGTGPAVSQGSARCMAWDGGRARMEAGTEALPAVTPTGDPDTGVYSSGANALDFSTAGVKRGGFDSTGNLDLPTNSAVSHSASGVTITGGSLVNIEFTGVASDDIGDWHENVTNPDRFTCPTGGNGVYEISAVVTFDESTAAGGGAADAGNVRRAAITFEGAVLVEEPREPFSSSASTGDPRIALSVVKRGVVATDIFRVACEHDNGGTMDVDAEIAIQKLA